MKKFRSTAAPKGAKLAAGYTDRTKDRVGDEDDDKAARVKALEEMMKLQQIDQATFEKLRDEIVGGDVGSVHLVKGLDYKLLERVRRGEDVLNGTAKTDEEEESAELDVEDEFEALEDREIAPVAKEKSVKKGEMAPPSLVPGKKRTRDQILAEMKAARQAAQEKKGPSLGARFKKVGATRNEPRYEKDSKGREVMITVDADGNEKRKVRKLQPEEQLPKGHGLLMPDKDAVPLGMEVPDIPAPAEPEDEDFDIFDDAGDDYDPLAGLDDDEDSGEEDSTSVKLETADSKAKIDADDEKSSQATADMPPPPRPQAPAVSRNYFGDSRDPEKDDAASKSVMADATILAALKKAASLHVPAGKSKEDKEREEKRKRMLQGDDRDAQDMDMGFGSSRFEDEEDFEEKKIKLSEWGSKGDDDDDDEKGDGKAKRKRGPKKRKGDGNNAADVMKVLERRKAAGS